MTKVILLVIMAIIIVILNYMEGDESFINEITNTDKEISNALGLDSYCSHLFRFPYGFSSKVYKKEKCVV